MKNERPKTMKEAIRLVAERIRSKTPGERLDLLCRAGLATPEQVAAAKARLSR